MAKILRNGDHLYPFFGDKMSFVRGLDPLGLQNNSEATFAMLLPGLNNVTGRLRYYSFYCWILDIYSNTVKSTDPKKQETFIRKAEYLLALINVNSSLEFDHIPGSNYSISELNKNNETINLNNGIYAENGLTEGSYWKYSNGAFGQYYSTSLISIGIIMTRDYNSKLYFRSSSDTSNFTSGEKLANAFDGNLKIVDKEIFIQCLKSGIVSRDQLINLATSFNAMHIPPNSEESKLLYSLLIQQDYHFIIGDEQNTNHRKETTKALLSFFGSKNPEIKPSLLDFTFNIYNSKGRVSEEINETLFGWFYYQFNDFWQFSNTAILNGLLNNLHTEYQLQSIPLKDFLYQQSEEIAINIRKYLEFSNELDAIEDICKFLEENPQIDVGLLTELKRLDNEQRITNSFLLIFKLYADNKNNLENLKMYGEKNKITRDGEASQYYLSEFSHKIKLTIKDFIYDFIKQHIILRHHLVAFRKIGGGTQTTQKFILEENHIRYIDNFEPNFTSPRLNTLHSFLRDLNLINNNSLTELGKEKLKNL